MRAVVTVKLPRHPRHDPQNKQISRCPVSEICSDCTGEHHSYLMTGETLSIIYREAKQRYGHVTRVELVPDSKEYAEFLRYIADCPMPPTELSEGEQVIKVSDFMEWRQTLHTKLLQVVHPWEFGGGRQ